jgi:hypothetical protein
MPKEISENRAGTEVRPLSENRAGTEVRPYYASVVLHSAPIMSAQTVTLINGLVQSLAWPLTLLIGIFLLRKAIGELLLRLRSVEHGDTKFSFEEEMHAISTQADMPEECGSATDDEPWGKPLEPMRNLATHAPRQAVLGAFSQLMEAFLALAQEHQIAVTDLERKTPKYLAQRLKSAGLIDAQTSDAFVSLRLLRNKVAHAESMPVSTKDALAFINTVASLMQASSHAPP